jgi:hypothetical protein
MIVPQKSTEKKFKNGYGSQAWESTLYKGLHSDIFSGNIDDFIFKPKVAKSLHDSFFPT